MKLSTAMALCALALAPAFAAQEPTNQTSEKKAYDDAAEQARLDAVKVDPKHYTIDFENDRVRVVRVQYGPHEKSVIMHEHPGDSVGIYLTDFHANVTFRDGSTREVDGKAGKTFWRAPAVTHTSTENLSDQPMEALWVELKSATASNIAEQEVRQVERELTEALGRGDVRGVERIYAHDYTLTSADGELQNKAQRIAALRLTDPKTTSRNREDIKVRIYGDTAVVTGRTLFKELVRGVERSEERRFTHVFAKRQGQWQMVASQVTPITSGQTVDKKASDDESEKPSRAEQEVLQAENERVQAVLHNDVAAMDRLLGAEFIVTDVQGRVHDKADEVALYRDARRRTESWEPSDVKVRVYADATVVTERAAVKDVIGRRTTGHPATPYPCVGETRRALAGGGAARHANPGINLPIAPGSSSCEARLTEHEPFN